MGPAQRGRYTGRAERELILELVAEAQRAGAKVEAVCKRLGVSVRTVQRWSQEQTAEDRRYGPRSQPANRLSEAERRRILQLANSEPYQHLSPKQLVPRLADEGVYVASESTIYRVLREAKLLAHRGKARPPTSRKPPEHMATGANQVWSWDITYLRGPVRGSFFYLYLVVDIFSRRIMGWEVHEEESSEQAAALLRRCWEEAGQPEGLHLHSDNGSPMKGATLLATLQALGVAPSFSRPRVSDDNPFSESLFHTLKYRPSFPDQPFESLEQAREWVRGFSVWYNTEHLHSALNFVTPDDRHFGREAAVLKARERVYKKAKQRRPERWSGETRDWSPAGPVRLNPSTAARAGEASAPGGTQPASRGAGTEGGQASLPIARSQSPSGAPVRRRHPPQGAERSVGQGRRRQPAKRVGGSAATGEP